MKRCFRCGTDWISERKRPRFKEYCSSCSAYLHCCKNCSYYEPHAHNHCRIMTTDWVRDPEVGNYCDDFDFADRDAESGTQEKRDAARKSFENLFGGEPPDENDAGKTEFEQLFGD